jgi:hypothetical protein
MSDNPGFVLKAGQMEVDGERVCAALVDFPNDPPDYLMSNIIWDRIPVAIVTEAEIESLRMKLATAEAQVKELEDELSNARETVAEEFEKDSTRAIKRLLTKTNFPFDYYDPDGWTAGDALDYLLEAFADHSEKPIPSLKEQEQG